VNFKKFLKFVQIRFIASLVTAKFSNSHNTSSRLHGGNCWMGTVGTWGLRFWHWGTQWSCRQFVDFVIGWSLELLTSQNF